jgi:hypothetical protein
MQEYFSMLYDQAPTDRIFQVTKSFLHHEMERGAKAAGVKKIRIHDLRHSHISHLIDLGFPAVAIADRVGHESIEITYHYSHLFPSKQTAMADKLDEVNAEFEGEVYEPEATATADMAEESAEMIDLDAVEAAVADSDKRNVVGEEYVGIGSDCAANSRTDDKTTKSNDGKIISFDKYRAG